MLKTPTSEGVYLLDLKANALRGCQLNHDNLTNRMALRRRWFIQISALSTFNRRVLAYDGVNG